jgi:hypothetical protein
LAAIFALRGACAVTEIVTRGDWLSFVMLPATDFVETWPESWPDRRPARASACAWTALERTIALTVLGFVAALCSDALPPRPP